MKHGRMFVVLVSCLAVCGGGIAQAQESSDPSFADVIEVNVVNVDVHVTDRSGRPVTDLRREDGEVSDLLGRATDLVREARIAITAGHESSYDGLRERLLDLSDDLDAERQELR